MDTLPDIPIDFKPQYNPLSNIDVAQFGDGYAQRAPSGINYQADGFSVSWSLLTQGEYHALMDFLRPKLNYMPFKWQPPWREAPMQWICTRLAATEPSSARHASINATFEQDFTL